MGKLKQALVILIALILVLLPVLRGAVISGLVGLTALGSLFFIHKLKKIEWLLVAVLGLGLFMSYAMSLCWTDNVEFGLKNLETKLALFILPISLSLIGSFNNKEQRWLWLSFVVGLLVSAFFHLSVSALQWSEGSPNSVFYYAELAKEFHPSYLSMYFCVGIAVLLFKDVQLKNTKWILPLKIILLAVFSGFVVLLFSKTGFIGLMALLVLKTIHILATKTYREFLLLPLSILVIGVVFNSAEGNQNRVTSSISSSNEVKKTPPTNTYRNSTESRIISWKSSVEIICENPLGVGVGDASAVLTQNYKTKGETYLADKNLNSHNQFLTTGIAIGALGILFLVLFFLVLGVRSVNQKDWLLAAVLGIVFINFMTESMLERADGTVFIPLIFSLLLFKKD